jgi:hypothetical protein
MDDVPSNVEVTEGPEAENDVLPVAGAQLPVAEAVCA